MAQVKIDRTRLTRVLNAEIITKKTLADECQISRPFLDRIIAGHEPAHPGVTLYINDVLHRYSNQLRQSSR